MTVLVRDRDLEIHVGDALAVLATLPAESVNCVVTSPPYWGLRDYGTGLWEGGDEGCDHLAPLGGGYSSSTLTHGPGKPLSAAETEQVVRNRQKQYGAVCGKCGARRVDQQLGLEPTPDAYVAALVDVFRQVRRVMRSDATCWVNLGDSFADKQLQGVPWRVAFALQADGWYLRSDIVWCLSGGTRLYARTQKGDQPQMLKDLVRLDPSTVELWNGARWTRVLSWTRADVRGAPLEIELASGERLNCTPAHVWPTQRGNVRADELAVDDVIETTRLPQPEQPDCPEFLPDSQIGYLVGRYLADGSASGDTVQIACHRDEADDLVDLLGPVATALHGSAVAHRTKGLAATVSLNGPLMLPVIRAYIHGGDAKTKGLRARVWRRSDLFLAALLDGYLAGDAHWDEKNLRYRLGFTRNDRLAADLRTLAARLDCPIRLVIGFTTGFGARWPIYRGDLRMAKPNHHNAREQGRVVAIWRSRGRHFWDVEVADDPHLFALASGVLTHNSKPNPMPESVTDRPTKSHEYVFLLSKSPRYFFDAEAVREPHTSTRWGGRYHTQPENGKYTPDSDIRHAAAAKARADRPEFDHYPDGGRNVRSVWEIATQPYAQAHFATYPEALVRRCILAGCPEWVCGTCHQPRTRIVEVQRPDFSDVAHRHSSKTDPGYKRNDGGGAFGKLSGQEMAARTTRTDLGWSDCGHSKRYKDDDREGTYRPGVVLDPFLGSGTTALVARKHGRRCIGIELSPAYAALAAERCSQLSLLAEAGTA